ncbi:hypothetical protein ACJ73_03351 [Blastomyces percursus]|uniref:Roadblock/LAMTOR2 domain-containing protein n=1 Tax=Blastomyces percursus TaxID=1658174 RepID=A0A1J9QA16_9EURO|nr:hypothetical protein ACJ73_03351 [Blastomyces percursus]
MAAVSLSQTDQLKRIISKLTNSQCIQPPQLSRQFSAHLSNLTSRPGVQSTLILSRKDGSIIRTTGLLATRSNPSPTRQASAPTTASISDPTSLATSPAPDQQATHPETNTSIDDRGANTAQQQAQEQQPLAAPYEPSQAETLAAHIFAFVSSASALSTSLSKPPPSSTSNGGNSGGSINETDRSGMAGGVAEANSSGHARNDSADSEGREREEDDELKLLRLRTKIHEIIIIPDRKFLLCVVHDLSAATGGSAAGGGGKGGGLSR